MVITTNLMNIRYICKSIFFSCCITVNKSKVVTSEIGYCCLCLLGCVIRLLNIQESFANCDLFLSGWHYFKFFSRVYLTNGFRLLLRLSTLRDLLAYMLRKNICPSPVSICLKKTCFACSLQNEVSTSKKVFMSKTLKNMFFLKNCRSKISSYGYIS